MAKLPNDYELDFLKNCTQEELEPLVGAILGTDDKGNIDRSGRFSSELDKKPAFTTHFPDHTKYVDEIIEELQKYGGNSIVNAVRGMGVSYHEVLWDVAKKMKVKSNATQTTQIIEDHLLAKVLEDAWEKMSEDDRTKLIDEAGNVFGAKVGGIGAGVLIQIIRAGGFKSYQIALIIANAVAKAILGRGLTFAGNIYLTRLLAVLAGPVGWIITGVWTAFDFASQAYRVTIPACIYIAALRKMKENEKFAKESEAGK
ncbi:MAG: hypothetical protein J6T51_05995 [Kiritimatiellae bacterium]|nr:hypothetical protein [Kiritimatiellia bacterium]